MTSTSRPLLLALLATSGCFTTGTDRDPILPARVSFAAGPPLVVKKTGQVFGIDVYHQINGTAGGTTTVSLAASAPDVATFGFEVYANTGAAAVDATNNLRIVYTPIASLHHRIGGRCGDTPGVTDLVVTSGLAPDEAVTIRIRCVAPTIPDDYALLTFADGQRLIRDGDAWTPGSFRSPVARLNMLDRSTLAALEQSGPCFVYRDLPLLGSVANGSILGFVTGTQDVDLAYGGRTWQATGAVSGPAFGDDRALTLTVDKEGAPRTYPLTASAAPTDLGVSTGADGAITVSARVPDADIVRFAGVGTSVSGGNSGFWCDLPASAVLGDDGVLSGPIFPPDVMPWFDEPDEQLLLSELTLGTFRRTGIEELVADTLPVYVGDLLTFDPSDIRAATGGAPFVPDGTLPAPDWFDGNPVTETFDNHEDVGDGPQFDTDVVFDRFGPFTIVMLNFGGVDSYGSLCSDESLGYNLFATTECWAGSTVALFTLDGDLQRFNVDLGRTYELVGASSGQLVDGAPPVGADRIVSMEVGQQEYIQLEPLTILTVRASQGPSGMELRITVEVAQD